MNYRRYTRTILTYSVTPLYRGVYTNVSKKAISTVLFAVSNVFLLYLYDILMSYL